MRYKIIRSKTVGNPYNIPINIKYKLVTISPASKYGGTTGQAPIYINNKYVYNTPIKIYRLVFPRNPYYYL